VALVVGQPLEHRSRVDVLFEGHELDRVPFDPSCQDSTGP
jgi:hypothetical protein